tara:strand:+ start:183 stop:686 length:504 start_codon:yes stop_codon:yes gene_type:complete
MKDKSLKQISTNIIPQGNVPNVPAHLQTGTYYPPTPPPIANPMGVAGMEAQNDMTGFGMGNQMGTYPLAQSDAELRKSMREERFRAEDAKTGEMAWRSSQYTPSPDIFENIEVGFEPYGKGSGQPKSQEVVKHGKHIYLGGARALPSDPKESPVYGIKPGGKSYWNT